MKNIRTILTFVILTAFLTILPAAHAWPDKSGIWYITSGQTVSGKASINIYVTGQVDGLYYWLEGPGPTAMIPYKDVPADSRPSYYDSDSHYYGFAWDTTKVPNGKYRWYASLKCSTCTTQDWVKQPDLKTIWLDLTVDNPPVYTPTPPAQDDNPSSCSQKLNEANDLTQRILEKSQNRFIYVDNFLQEVKTYYNKRGKKAEGYEELSNKADESRKKASDSLVLLEQKSQLNCSSSLATQINAFISQLQITRNNLDEYTTDVINLVLGIIK